MQFNKIFLLFLGLVISSHAQSVSVSGKVTSNRFPISDVLITLIDNSDTTLQYTALTDSRGTYQIGVLTSVEDNENSIPISFNLGQSYPNPFSSTTSIPFGLEKESNVSVEVYDILGRSVRKFDVGKRSTGIHNLLWDGRNNFGHKVANGIYFYKLTVENNSQVKKMIFNSNAVNSMSLPGSFSSLQKEPILKSNHTENIEGTEFTIRIQNSNNTLPLIIENQIENVTIKNDTTIIFTVSTVPTAFVNLDSTHQTISGYGAATPWYLSPATDSEMQSAFGMDDGEIGFTIFRLTIDPDSNNWARWVPSAKKAHEMGAKIIASPWHAPISMREPLPQDYRVRYDMYDEYAEHLNSFAKYMADNNAPVYAISVQNEPDIGDWTQWTIDEMLTFVRDYGHLIEYTKLMAPESFNFKRSYGDPILNDSTACANTDIICGHIYGGGLFKYPLAEEKGKEVWMTEYLMGENNSGNNLFWTIELAKNIHDVMKANMNAYVWWTMVRYYGPIGDGNTASNPDDPRERYPDKGEVTKKGFAMSQFSKFIRPGFVRVESKDYPTTSTIYTTAYKDSESSITVIVLINTNDTEVEQYLKIEGLETAIFSNYTTNGTKNFEQGDDVILKNGVSLFTLEPESITTFISE